MLKRTAEMMSEAVIAAAEELLSARNYSSVVAVASHALDDDETDTAMRMLRARALVALHRDEEAQSDLRECLRRRSRCAPAYSLLGQLCFRRDEFDSAVVFLKEALRLDAEDEHARDLLAVASGFLQSTAAVEKLPAATAAVDCSVARSVAGPCATTAKRFSEPRVAKRPPRLANGTATPAAFESKATEGADFEGDVTDCGAVPGGWEGGYAPVHLNENSDDEHLRDYIDDCDGLSEATELHAWPVSAVGIEPFTATEVMDSVTIADPPDDRPHHRLTIGVEAAGDFSRENGPKTIPQRRRSRVAFGSEHDGEPTVPERHRKSETARNFGRFLLRTGALTPNQLHAAFDYQRRSRVSLAKAVVVLGYASEPTVRTAGLAFRAERGKRR